MSQKKYSIGLILRANPERRQRMARASMFQQLTRIRRLTEMLDRVENPHYGNSGVRVDTIYKENPERLRGALIIAHSRANAFRELFVGKRK